MLYVQMSLGIVLVRRHRSSPMTLSIFISYRIRVIHSGVFNTKAVHVIQQHEYVRAEGFLEVFFVFLLVYLIESRLEL